MRIEDYFQQVRQTLDASLLIQSLSLATDKRGSNEGFIQGQVYFVDGSILHLREYVDVETAIDRLTYVYQYMNAAGQLVFRYDNTGHHKKLNLPTYPHHKHLDNEENVLPSSAPTLANVLQEIETLVQLP